MHTDQRDVARTFSKRVTVSRSLSFQNIPTDETLSWSNSFSRIQLQSEGPRGQVIGGNYTLGRVLETGGMSTVHLAVDNETGEEVAVKMALLPFSESFNRSIWAEARLLSNLEHPNIVRFIDSGTHKGSAFMVMEYLRAKELHEIIDDFGPLDWQSSIPTLIEICDTLQFIHEAGLVHGDVKPSNIMVLPGLPGDGPGIKLVDFGMARSAALMEMIEDRAPERVRGTVPFMAPELFSSIKSFYDKRVDIYSFGVVMYGMLTRINPFQGPGCCDVENMLLVVNHEPDHPSTLVPEVPRAAGDIVMRAMAKDPNDRFSSMAEMREAIQRCQ